MTSDAERGGQGLRLGSTEEGEESYDRFKRGLFSQGWEELKRRPGTGKRGEKIGSGGPES